MCFTLFPLFLDLSPELTGLTISALLKVKTQNILLKSVKEQRKLYKLEYWTKKYIGTFVELVFRTVPVTMGFLNVTVPVPESI